MSKKSFSGKFVLRISSELHRDLYDLSMEQGKSLNQLCVERLANNHIVMNPPVDGLKKFLGNEVIAIYQYGSTVRGEATAMSDVDILCVIDNSVVINRELYSKWDAFMNDISLNKKYSIHFVHTIKNIYSASSLWLEISLSGVPLYDSGSCIQKKLIQLRQLTYEGYYQRKLVHGQPMWVKNEEMKNA